MPATDRFVALVAIAITVLIVWLLLGVDPDARGHGTHEQLGMARCAWPSQYGIPCPTCGCTTAAAHLVHLSPWRAFVTQPFGALLALLGIAFGGLALHSLVRGRSLVERISMWPYPKMLLIGVAVFLLSWLYKWLTWAE